MNSENYLKYLQWGTENPIKYAEITWTGAYHSEMLGFLVWLETIKE